MLRRLQKDVLKHILPPRYEALLFCRPSLEQRRLYKDMTKTHCESFGSCDALNTLTALRKLCSHPSLLIPGRPASTKETGHSGKLHVLSALLDHIRNRAPLDKLVIVSNFTSALSLIEKALLIPKELAFQRLDGNTNLTDRQTIVDSFNRTSPEACFALLLSSKAGGCGLNLVGGTLPYRIFFFIKTSHDQITFLARRESACDVRSRLVRGLDTV